MINTIEALLNSFAPHFSTSLMVVIPAIIGGIIHMIVVSKNLFSFLTIPVSKKLFGENKTIRGFIIMPSGAAIGALIAYFFLENNVMTITINDGFVIPFGLIIGFAYVLFELPNSFLKRKLGIKPGESAKNHPYLFIILDQIDSNIGICIAAYFIFKAPFISIITMFLVGIFFALTIKRLLFVVKLKKTAT